MADNQFQIPKTHRVWTSLRAGPPREVLNLNQYAPVPASHPPPPSSLVVRVAYSALNPADLFLIGSIPTWLPWRRSPTHGFDFSGTVVAAGAEVPPEYAAGARVAGALGIREVWVGKGTLTEYLSVDWRMVTRVPEFFSASGRRGMDKAAGVFGIAGQTAEQMVETVGGAKGVRGRKVLVYGASGGVGGFAVQICKGLGAESVCGVCSGRNDEMVRGLGADEVR